MAKFIGSGRQKGLLELMEIKIRNEKKKFVPKILTSDLKKPLGNIVSNEILEYFNETMDKSLTTVEDEEIENKKFWMNLINPKKTEYFSIVEKYKKNHKLVETINAILAIVSIFMSELEYELAYYPTFIKNNTTNTINVAYSGDVYRIIISALCGLMCIISFYSCHFDFIIKREQKKIVNITFINSYYFIRLSLELFINVVHPFPGYDFNFDFELLGMKIKYNFQTFLYALMYLKTYHVIRVLTLYTKFKTIQSEKYCDHYGGEADTIFALKSLQKDNPFLILSLTFMFNVLIVGLLLRMFEILNTQTNGNIDYNFYTNGIWNICIAMTTGKLLLKIVGYGDFFPKTHIGRFMTVYGIFIGIFLTSLLIVALNKACSFDLNGLKSYIILRRMYHKNELKQASFSLIQNMFRQYLRRKKFGEIIKSTIKASQFKEIAICNVQEKSIEFQDVDPHMAKLRRDMEPIIKKRKHAKNEIEQETYISSDYKFIDLTHRIYEDLRGLKKELYKLEEYKYILSSNIKQSEKILEHLNNTIKLMKVNVKKKFLKLIYKNEIGAQNYLQPKSDLNESNISINSLKLKELPFEDIFTHKEKNYEEDKLIIKKMLSSKIDQSYFKIKNQNHSRHKATKHLGHNNEGYVDSQSKSFLQQDDSLNNIVIREEFNYMDKNTRGLLGEKSQKTLDLLTDLKKMRLKIANDKANKAIWEEENSFENNRMEISPKYNTPNIVFVPAEPTNSNVLNPTPINIEEKKCNEKNDSLTNNAEDQVDFRKPLLAKLEKQIKENSSKIAEEENKDFRKKKNLKNVSIKEDSTPLPENGDETNLFRKNQDNKLEADSLKFQINNKINNINKLLVGVINNNKKEKSSLFMDDSNLKK